MLNLSLARAKKLWSLLRRPPIEKLFRKTAALGRKGGRAGAAAVDKLSKRQLDNLIRRDAGRSISTLHRALRELRQVDEKLLAALETKLTARRYLDMILEAGTLVELLRLARHSTPATARRLVALLSAADVDLLQRRTTASKHSIGTLGAALKALDQADEDLSSALEEKLDERLFLDLVLDSGTFFELFRFLGYPRPQATRRLIAALKATDVERLRAQTVASGRSLGTLELALRKLALIDEQVAMAVIEKIGVYRWWRLILARGNLSVLSGVVRYAGWDFGQQLLAVLATAPTAELEVLLLRGDLFQFCRLLRWRSHQMVSAVSSQLFDRLRPALEELLERADWPTRARAAYQLAHAPPLPLMRATTTLVWDRLEAVEPPAPASAPPEGDKGNEEMRILLHCTRYLVTADPRLSSRSSALVERHLGAPDGWPRSPGFVRWGRHLLRMACEPEIGDATAAEWLRVACRPEVATLLADATTLDVFLYLWNLYALWFQWREDAADDFREALADTLRAESLRAFLERGAAPEDEELYSLLALAGILRFSGLAEETDLAPSVEQRWPDPERLALLLEGGTFVPSALAVLGYEALLGEPCGAAPDVAERLDRYPAPTAAMRLLHLWLQH